MTAFTDALTGMQITGPDLKPGDVVVDVVIITRVQRMDEKDSSLLWHATDHTDSITELGLVRATSLLMESGYTERDEDDE